MLHGTPDVVVYGPGDVSRLPVAARSLDVDTLGAWLPLHLFTPIRLLNALLPEMTERGSGAVVFAHGISVRQPMPALASVSIPQSGLVNYLRALDTEVRARGVRVGSLQIGRLIEGSAAARLFDSSHFDGVDVGEVQRVHPDVLARNISRWRRPMWRWSASPEIRCPRGSRIARRHQRPSRGRGTPVSRVRAF
ncbi:hypothetical protein [Nocardia sp. NPDC050406]|uniref:hypothetical protein n=1 Tax=Nocardia sp. NPDC050406 TaxID=3364318 RepID=UPI0037B837FD